MDGIHYLPEDFIKDSVSIQLMWILSEEGDCNLTLKKKLFHRDKSTKY